MLTRVSVAIRIAPVNSTHYIEVYAADGTPLDHDEWASAQEAIDAANTAEGMAKGSFIVVLTAAHEEIYRRVY
jgi:hypothetical protein